jgi:CheY-like chemotaxis protein
MRLPFGRTNGVTEAEDERQNAGSEATAPQPPALSKPHETSFELVRRRRVLVVDDNRDSADSLTMLLRLAGDEVETAYDGQDGLEIARQWRPDIILLDIGLPRLDGYELARCLRGEFGLQQPVLVATTGYGKDEDRRMSQEAGFDAHLVKPVDLEELRQIMAGLTAGPQPPQR